jgi:GNAT superfamily N-acetyltransferase
MAELRAYDPTWRDRLAGLLMGDGRASPERRAVVRGLLGSTGLGTTGMGLLDATPAGMPLAANDAHDSLRQGDYVSGAIGAMALIPGLKGPIKSVDALRTGLAAKYPGVDLWLSGRAQGPVVVNKVVVPPEMRGQGVGTSVMNDILSFADQERRALALTPSADFGGNKAQLESWYRGLGFVPNKGRSRDHEISETMYRLPRE